MDKQNTRSENKINLAETQQQRSAAFNDAVIIFVIAILIYLLGHAFNLFDSLDKWLERVALAHFDELLLLLLLGFGIYSVRRWRELKAEAVERKRVKESLRESEEMFRQLAENIREVFFIRDLEQNQMIYVSPTYEEVWQQAWENIYKNPTAFLDSVVAEDYDRVSAALEKQDQETFFNSEYRIMRPDGTIRWVWARTFPIKNEAGIIYRLAGIVEDVTEQKRAEEALRESETRLAEAQRIGHMGSWERNMQTDTAYWSDEHYRIFGLPPQEVAPPLETVLNFVHPDDRSSIHQSLQEISEQHISAEAKTYRIVKPDGEIRVIDARREITFDEAGRALRIAGIIQDITERKQAEAELKQQKERLQKIVDNIPVMIVFISPDGKTEWVNREWQQALGWTLEEARSRDLLVELYPDPNERQEVLDFALRPLPSGWRDFHTRVKDGRVLDTTWANVLLSDGSSIGIGQDITERKAMERELQVSEQRFRQLFARAPISIWEEDFSAVGDWLAELRARGVRDLDAFLQAEPQALEQALGLVRLVDINDTTLQLWEANSKEELLNFWTSLFTDDTFRVFAGELRAIWEGENQVDFECSAQTVRGRPIHYVIHWVAPLEDGRMNLRRVIVAIADITERKLAEEEIKRQATRAATLTRIAARLNKQLELEVVIHAVCEEALDTFKVSQSAMSLYDKKSDLLVYAGGINIPPEGIAIMEPINRARFDEFVRTMGPTFVIPDVQSLQAVPNVELHARQDKRTVVISTMFRGQELIGTVTLGVIGHVREFNKDELALLKAISDQAAQAIANARLFEQVEGAQERLKALSHRLLEVQEMERRQIALELHDQIGQNLTAIKLNMQAAQRTTQASALASILEENIATIERALDRVRNMSLDLRPSMLDDLGLVAALRWYIDRLARQAGLAITFTAESLETRPDSTLETTCFRVAQEALTNVIRHAQAQQVQVELWQQEAELNLLIRDDGRGFDVTPTLKQAAHGASVGLLGMQERVKLADGWLEIESSSGYGTEIRACFPLTNAGETNYETHPRIVGR